MDTSYNSFVSLSIVYDTWYSLKPLCEYYIHPYLKQAPTFSPSSIRPKVETFYEYSMFNYIL